MLMGFLSTLKRLLVSIEEMSLDLGRTKYWFGRFQTFEICCWYPMIVYCLV